MDRVAQLFELLDRWRHLPAYQLERRADVLFALYLPAFLSDHLGVAIRPEMIPEFPVRIGTIYPDTPQSEFGSSCKIDYVALSEDGSKVWFVELKTDGLSRRDRQDDYLKRAQTAGMPALIDGLLKIFGKTQARSKYYHLLKAAESVGLLKIPDSFHRCAENEWRRLKKELATIHISPLEPKISVIYLQPRQGGTDEIGFDALAEWMERFDDPFSRRFRDSLRRWAQSPAGISQD